MTIKSHWWTEDCTTGECEIGAAPAPVAYLDPLHNELDRLRTLVVDLQNDIRDSDNCLEQAEARVDQLTNVRDTYRAAWAQAEEANERLTAQLAKLARPCGCDDQ